jgi:hypothetical protein
LPRRVSPPRQCALCVRARRWRSDHACRGKRLRRKLKPQRFAGFENIVDQDDQRTAFAPVATDLFAPRRFVLRVAAVGQPVCVAGLTAAFAFIRGIAGVWHSNLKKGGGGTLAADFSRNAVAEEA